MNLLSTIRVPKNLLYLTDRLPKPMYDSSSHKRREQEELLRRRTYEGTQPLSQMLPELSSGNGSADRRAYDNTSQAGSIQMTPGGPGSNANSGQTKKLKASAVGNIIHQDQKEDRGSHKKPKRMEGDDDMPNQGSRETSRARQNVSGLNSQKRASKAEGPKALR
jgi:hypothetical protein